MGELDSNLKKRIEDKENKELQIKKINEKLDSLKEIEDLISSLPKIKKIKINKENYKQFKSKSNKNIGKREYSTHNTIKKMDFNIDSPIFIELKRILNNSNFN